MFLYAVAATLLATAPIGLRAESGPPPAAKAGVAQKTFPTPEAASRALADAVRGVNRAALLTVLGPQSERWLFTGDDVTDRADWKKFLAAYDLKNAIVKEGDAKAFLEVGNDNWLFPAPLVKRGDTWVFDAEAGREETARRRIGRNELSTIQTLLAVVDAQREYAAADADQNGFNDYARKFISSAGKKDGLYWPAKPGETPSPLGPLVGAAASEGYGKKTGAGTPIPYHGYYYRLLTTQGREAAGGAYSYLVNGRMIGGFSVVAYPAKYGVSGVMTFLVNHDGVIYEKDLGSTTNTQAAKMSQYNPDKTWKKTQK
jgi:hypothetical protein